MIEPKKNVAASVHQSLYNRARESGEDFNGLLIRYANKRFLYRLGASEYQDRFLLKGASLLALWFAQPHRPTRDIDLLGFSSSEISDVETIFRDICLSKTREDDGLLFKAESVKAAEIKEDQEYRRRENYSGGVYGKSANQSAN